MIDAFEKYYADDVVMQEINMEPTVGKDANREREIKWLEGITDFRGAEVKNLAVGIMYQWLNGLWTTHIKNMVMLKLTRLQYRPGKTVK